MSPSETRALRRAALLLVLLSAVRWGLAIGESPGASPGPSAALELRDASSEALSEAERRAAPLAPGERLDPNRASAVELDRLPGVGASTASALVRDREARGPYRSPQDLLRVPGVGPATLARLAPHLDLSSPPPAARPARGGRGVERVDLNGATGEELRRLPGIGPALAGRILQAREERPFARVDDLLRVSGIGPATLERLRPLVGIGGIR